MECPAADQVKSQTNQKMALLSFIGGQKVTNANLAFFGVLWRLD
jgi:hypothetical protein